jgi:hypothetical protein
MGDAKAFGLIEEEISYRQNDGAAYSTFKLKTEVEPTPEAYGELGMDRAKELIALFTGTNVTVLELAATVDWLWRSEGYKSGWKQEITKRKGVKVGGGRLEKAIDLLRQLDLAPPASIAA